MLHQLKCCFSLTFGACLWHAVASFVGELPQVEQGGLLDPILAGQKNLDETLNGFMEFSKVAFCLCVVCPHECIFACACASLAHLPARALALCNLQTSSSLSAPRLVSRLLDCSSPGAD